MVSVWEIRCRSLRTHRSIADVRQVLLGRTRVFGSLRAPPRAPKGWRYFLEWRTGPFTGNPFARVTGGRNDVNDVGQDQGELVALRWPSLVHWGVGLKCQGCGTDQDVKIYQFGIDLPITNAYQVCIMLLSDPRMADRLEVKESWRTNEP